MTAHRPISSAPLRIQVKEPSPGLFSWFVTQLPMNEHAAEVCIDASDHPYPSYEAAMSVGAACLKAHKEAARETFLYDPHVASSTAHHQVLRSGCKGV